MTTDVKGTDVKGLGLENFSASEADVKAKEAGAKSAPVTKTIQIGKDTMETPKDAAPADDSSCCFSYLCCIPQAILSAITSLWRCIFGSGSDKVEPKPGDTSKSDPRLIVEKREIDDNKAVSGKSMIESRTLSDATLKKALAENDRELLFKCTTVSFSKDVLPLHELFTAKAYDLIVELIAKGKCSVNQADKEGNTLLHLFANMGDECLSIKAGAEGNKKELFRWLLSQGADPELTDAEGRNPLLVACGKGAFGCAQLLVPHTMTNRHAKDNNGNTVAHLIASAGNAAAFDVLVANVKTKPSFNLFNKDKQSLLHVICRNAPLTTGHIQIFKLICADTGLGVVNARDSEGNTALAYACRFGHVEAVKALITAGAATEGTDIVDNEGNTPLLLIAKDAMSLETNVKVEITKLLMKNKLTNLLAKDNKGYAVIHYLAQGGQADVLGTIVEAKPAADLGVNEPAGELGLRPLHLAVSNRQATMTSSLIRYLNADKTLKDNAGNTAEALAHELHADPGIRQFLVETLQNEVYTPPLAPPPPVEEVAKTEESDAEEVASDNESVDSSQDLKEPATPVANSNQGPVAQVETSTAPVENITATVVEQPVVVAEHKETVVVTAPIETTVVAEQPAVVAEHKEAVVVTAPVETTVATEQAPVITDGANLELHGVTATLKLDV